MTSEGCDEGWVRRSTESTSFCASDRSNAAAVSPPSSTASPSSSSSLSSFQSAALPAPRPFTNAGSQGKYCWWPNSNQRSSFLCLCFLSYKSKESDQKLSEVPSRSDMLWFQDARRAPDSFPSFQSIPHVSSSAGLESVSVKGAAGRGETWSQTMRQAWEQP